MRNLFFGGNRIWLLLVFLLGGQAWAVDINFDGNLLDRPCQVASESQEQNVMFMVHPTKDFWSLPARSPVEKFTIHLADCDTSSVWKVVKLKFSGAAEMNMQGQSDYFLKVTGENEGKLAVGLLDTDGKTPLKLGVAHNHEQGTQINRTDLQLIFGAFVQATPEAVAEKSVKPGQYSAIANFELAYE